jgi:oxidoreductase AflY
MWALGATPNEMQDMYDYNQPYQAPLEKRADDILELDLSDAALFDQSLGKDECYVDFLRFFKMEIAEKGVPSVVREYVLKGDDRANDIFGRMYTGELTYHEQIKGLFSNRQY